MQPLYILAALLAFTATVAHSWLGEKFLIGPLLASQKLPGVLKPAINRRLVRAVWHLPSAIWAVIGLYVLWVALVGAIAAEAAIALGAVFAVSGIANLAAVRRLHFAWAVLFSAAAALWIGGLL